MSGTQTGLLERLQACSEIVTLPEQLGACRLVTWLKPVGQPIERFDALAVVEQDQVLTTITATHTGVLRRVVIQPGMVAQPSQILCYIEVPFSSKQCKTPAKGLVGSPSSKDSSLSVPHAPTSEASANTKPPRRSSILPEVEQLVRERAAQKRSPLPANPTKKPRTKAKVYRVTPRQVGQVKSLVRQIRTHDSSPPGPPISESELIRAGIELLSSLSLGAVLAIVEENREREQAGKYGAGWPRPGRHRPRRNKTS